MGPLGTPVLTLIASLQHQAFILELVEDAVHPNLGGVSGINVDTRSTFGLVQGCLEIERRTLPLSVKGGPIGRLCQPNRP